MGGIVRKQPIWYYCKTWRENFYFFRGWKIEDFVLYLKKKYEYELEVDHYADGFYIEISLSKSGYTYFIWTKGKTKSTSDIATLAHECLHVTLLCLERRGVKFDPFNSEPFTYLMAALIRAALEKK